MRAASWRPTNVEHFSVIRRLGVVRAADLEEQGIPRRRLYALLQKGKVERQARGIYAASNHARTADHALAQVAKLPCAFTR